MKNLALPKYLLVAAILLLACLNAIPSNSLTCLDADEEIMKATVKIQSGNSIGSGFIVMEPIGEKTNFVSVVLVTAAHVLAMMPSTNVSLCLRVDDGGIYKKLPWEIPIRSNGTNLWTQHPSADVAVMRISIPTLSQVGRLATSTLYDEQFFRNFHIHPGDEVRVLGFPYGFEANNAGFPVLRSGRIASYPLVPFTNNPTFMIDFRVFPGNSGGPVYISERRALVDGSLETVSTTGIVGLVSEEAKITETISSLTERSIKSYDLGVGIIIPSPFISETIKMLPPWSP